MLCPSRVRYALLLVAAFLLVDAAASEAQTGGFLESATSTAYRTPLSPAQIQGLAPDRGRFTFPAPYSTLGARLTTAADCGGADCVDYVGYAYWNNINNHVGSDTMLVFIGLNRSRGGTGPTLFTYDKQTGETRNAGPLFDTGHPLSWATGEGWYFSRTLPTALYVNDGPRMLRHDVLTRVSETVYDARTLLGRTDVYIWQMHSSTDDRVHSATIRHASTYQPLGCIAYREDTGQSQFFAAIRDFDECQVDKSGRWLVIKENLDGRNGEDNRIVDLSTGLEQVFYDEYGAAGHSDLGFGYMVAEDNYAAQPGAARVWNLTQDLNAQGQGTLVYHLTSWNAGLGHLAHSNANASTPLAQQVACSSNATRQALPRVNEIVCYRLDGSLQVLVVAPNLTDLNAAGGGSDDYAKLPKGNLDVTGEYFVWTANAGGNRLDAFIVHVPLAQLTGGSSGGSSGGGSGTPGAVTWLSAVNLSTGHNSLEKIGGCDGCPDATAVSHDEVSNGGWVAWTAPDTQTLRVLGLAPGTTVAGAADLPFAIRLQGGTAEIRELGVYRSDVAFAAGDTFRIAVEGGTVRYQKNGTTFYTSTTAATTPLRVKAVFYNLGAIVSGIGLGSSSGGTGGTPPPPPPPPSITLTASGYKVKGVQRVDLRWSGASSAVTISRNGAVIVSNTANDGFHTDDINRKGSGTYVYTACDTSGACSPDTTVTFK